LNSLQVKGVSMAHKLVVIADASSLFRIGIKTLLDREGMDFDFIEASDEKSLMASLNDRLPSILILDLGFPGFEGLSGVSSLAEHFPDLKICLLVPAVSQSIAAQVLSLGVSACIEKDSACDELADALSTAMAGRVYLSRIEKMQADLKDLQNCRLTPQQHRVMALVSCGKSNKEIARDLNIREGTVKVHVSAAYRSLGVRNRVEASVAMSQLADANVGLPDRSFELFKA